MSNGFPISHLTFYTHLIFSRNYLCFVEHKKKTFPDTCTSKTFERTSLNYNWGFVYFHSSGTLFWVSGIGNNLSKSVTQRKKCALLDNVMVHCRKRKVWPVYNCQCIAMMSLRGTGVSGAKSSQQVSLLHMCSLSIYLNCGIERQNELSTYTIGNCNPRFSRRGYFFPKRHNLLSIFSPLILCSKV